MAMENIYAASMLQRRIGQTNSELLMIINSIDLLPAAGTGNMIVIAVREWDEPWCLCSVLPPPESFLVLLPRWSPLYAVSQHNSLYRKTQNWEDDCYL
ncbi:hypothetical protein G7K_2327-t1 [Saitoella complicata NRRL Y-17804]|uniref:Uncharacterized protein n=1 Tax=Saitoella complicata (strain BCRC 22490 / CBS 7301 / JCM 7358 / NBRC 10748 / NRRL Y-17804) TaxID=698492 RepID=A0A0E9NFF8_SAICN|nr:hypothetical protein G7K_2327-t1 [Saitoella complicata NRRL Y-17804]